MGLYSRLQAAGENYGREKADTALICHMEERRRLKRNSNSACDHHPETTMHRSALATQR